MDENELKRLLGDDLYSQLKNLQKIQANTDMCQIGQSIEEVNLEYDCHQTLPNQKELENYRDKFIQDLTDRFMPKPSDVTDKRKQLQECTDSLQEIAFSLSSSYSAEGNNQNEKLYFFLYSFFNVLAHLYVYYKIYGYKYDYNSQFSISDGYWKDITRLKDYYKADGIRDYAFHNTANTYYVERLTLSNDHQRSTNRSIIREYNEFLSITEEEVKKNISGIMTLFTSRSSIFYEYVNYVIARIYSKIESNYSRLKLESMGLLIEQTVSTQDYIVQRLSELYSGIQSILDEHLEKDRYELTQILDKDRRSLIVCSDLTQLDRFIKEGFSSLQSDLEKYYKSIDIYDDQNSMNTILTKMSKLKCMEGIDLNGALEEGQKLMEEMQKSENGEENNLQEENPKDYEANLKDIPINTEEYDLLKPKYWQKYTGFLNLVSLIPTHWTIGIILPPAVRIPLPIVYVFLTVIYVQPILTVMWLTINGIVICPVILTIDFSGGSAKSTWLTLFRGANAQIKSNGGCTVQFSGGLQPEIVNLEGAGSTAIIDKTPQVTKTLPFSSDDYPVFKRLSLTNPVWLVFLNSMCSTAKPYMGLP